MGGKGGQITAPPPQEVSNDNSDLIAMLMMSQMAQQAAMPQMPQAPQALQMPQVAQTSAIDWAKQQKELKAKTLADYTASQQKKKGVSKTVHSKSLLDDETPETTSSSILVGK
jgi:hypothetical protein